ncbi:tRNA threonylcarbamoyladenosine biosynthesis protein TsaB [Rubripirellula lacrimiformis]|uniref:N(6)-L-threonylcarbamoyladenine synthase n=1 Tax=Rubripirellula lacrimiformis TaxID=1930273 RepID=A0A517NAZ3_9BACT|nr:tRNA threonylcarbamoyladenosine biosynthesis protein TsaB [Rubripirellula lacrimiformis]
MALFSKELVLRRVSLDPGLRTAASLAPAIAEIIQWCSDHPSLESNRLGFISVADGPGSFTGLRIGVTTAKTLAYALKIPLVSVDSLAAIAACRMAQHPSVDQVLAAIDAFRGEIFQGKFCRSQLLPPLEDLKIDKHWSADRDSTQVQSIKSFQKDLPLLAETYAFAGDAKAFGDHAQRRLESDCDAVGVGMLGLRAAIQGRLVDPMQLVPRYLKRSAAEEKAAESILPTPSSSSSSSP